MQTTTTTRPLVVLASGYVDDLLLMAAEVDSVMQWKKYLTTMQITQFVLDISLVYFGSMSFSIPFSRSVD